MIRPFSSFLTKYKMGVLSTLRNFFNMDGNKKAQPTNQTVSKAERNGKVKSIQSESVTSKKEAITSSVKNDSDSKSSISSPTTSTKQQTSSSGYSYKYKDGRRYHADESVAYVLPNDDSGKSLHMRLIVICVFTIEYCLCTDRG